MIILLLLLLKSVSYLSRFYLFILSELGDALSMLGCDPGQDMPILAQIKTEVRKLNTKQIIWTKITNLEKALEFEHNKRRFIYSEEPDDDETTDDRPKTPSKNSKTRKSNEQLNKVIYTEVCFFLVYLFIYSTLF